MTVPLQKKLSSISIAHKLYFTVGIMALLITIELCTLWFAITTLSAVRSYVGGEGLWSKAQKDAVFHLRIYAYSHNESDYQDFRAFLKVPLGDKRARIQLANPNPDFEAARQGFLEGRNHPDDIDGMIKLIMRFHKIYYLNKAFTIWGEAEQTMEQFIPMGEQLHAMILSKNVSQQEIDRVLKNVELNNIKVTKLEDDFSFTLGEGSRWLEHVVLRILLTLSLTIGTTSILITISVSRGIERGVKAIIDGAKLIGQGLFDTRVKVYSNDEIGLLAASFNQMTGTLEQNIKELKEAEEKLKKEKERAEASEKVKQLFLANMSHEIRTPMNAILGFAQLMEELVNDKEQKEYINLIIKSGDDLLVILNDILDFSRIEAGKVTFERLPFNLRDIMHSTITMMEAKAKAKNIGLVYHIDEKVPYIILGDTVRMSQILLNLVSNAIKFTEKGEIAISVRCVDEGKDNIVLEFAVKDTGIGIPLEKQEKIFESFEQATPGTMRRFGGTGLGLSIVKQLVELQDGKIFVNSEPGKGSDFHFRMPFLKEKIQKNEPVEIPDKDTGKMFHIGKGIRVLIVDDNPINLLLVERILKKQSFETETADNGKTALEKFSKNDYDIILMDLQMPEMDGYDATIRIRNLNNDKKNVPIIAMTAHTIKGEMERCMEIGMNDYISKPFHVAELYEKIHLLVAKS